ncbi:F-box only protein 36-like [Platysternon megacephalum]|uniref:F-box only protein 36-like n=1 Tax=Platysternon megacephalum TaxID=55544 RepID=A0A4D9EHM2_9SAUR|nr:F-box only protein 36-like [Platysternon megacephalum]
MHMRKSGPGLQVMHGYRTAQEIFKFDLTLQYVTMGLRVQMVQVCCWLRKENENGEKVMVTGCTKVLSDIWQNEAHPKKVQHQCLDGSAVCLSACTHFLFMHCSKRFFTFSLKTINQ